MYTVRTIYQTVNKRFRFTSFCPRSDSKNMLIQKLISGTRMRKLDEPSKRHTIRNNANKESSRIVKKSSTDRVVIIRGAAVERAVVLEDKVVVGIKKQLISVSSLALSHPSSLRRNQKNSLMRTHQQSKLPLAMEATAKPVIDR